MPKDEEDRLKELRREYRIRNIFALAILVLVVANIAISIIEITGIAKMLRLHLILFFLLLFTVFGFYFR
jgi:hypothetical protein